MNRNLTISFNCFLIVFYHAGDAYVCCSGLPFLRPGTAADHAANCIRMGFAMLREIASIRTVEGGRVAMRLGMHIGTVVAGVVGTKKLRYDIWCVENQSSSLLSDLVRGFLLSVFCYFCFSVVGLIHAKF